MSQLRNEVDAHKENKNTEQSRIGNSKFIDLANLKINLKTMFHNSLNTKRDEIKSTKINSKDKIDNDNKISIKTSEKVIIEIDSKTPEFGPGINILILFENFIIFLQIPKLIVRLS